MYMSGSQMRSNQVPVASMHGRASLLSCVSTIFLKGLIVANNLLVADGRRLAVVVQDFISGTELRSLAMFSARCVSARLWPALLCFHPAPRALLS